MKARCVSVHYKENCGGTLRNLARGFRGSASSPAELDLYDDLSERIFEQPSPAAEKISKLST